MGGAGKTQLSLEYCLRMKDERRFRAIFWLDASSRNALYGSMETAAKQLLPDRVLDNPEAAVILVKEVLSSWSERRLVVRRHWELSTHPHSTPSTTWVPSTLVKAVSKMQR